MESANTSPKREVIKAFNDEKLYRHIVLDNKLEVVLIQNNTKTDESLAYCSLSIGVGSYSDPEDAQGLAHLFEHMLTQSSQKYPELGEFDEFLSQHAGYANAHTEYEHTSYYFEVDDEHLDNALDRFSDFLVKPKFQGEAIENELQVVHSEFELTVQKDMSRLDQLICSSAPQSHLLNRFAWGNKESLIKDASQLRDLVEEFYGKYCSADIMKLVILSNEDLDTLEQKVKSYFAAVPNLNIHGTLYPTTINLPVVPDDSATRVWKMETVKDSKDICISFFLPPFFDDYKVQPLEYLAYTLGHETKGSILSLLKEMNYAIEITSTVEMTAGEFTLMCLIISVTDEGYENYREIVRVVFEYIEMMKSQFKEKKWFFEELEKISHLKFNHCEGMTHLDFCSNLSESMLTFPIEDTIRCGLYSCLLEYSEDKLEKYLSALTWQNCRIDLLAKTPLDVANGEIKTEKWFNTVYQGVGTTEEDIRFMRVTDKKFRPELHFPIPNMFIPQNTTLLETPCDENEEERYPTLIHEDESMKVFHLLDTEFRAAQASCGFYLVFKQRYRDSQKSEALNFLLAAVIEEIVNETGYFATMSETEYSITPKLNGIEVTLLGFSDILTKFIPEFFKCIAQIREGLTSGQFKLRVQERYRSFSNRLLNIENVAHDALNIYMIRGYHWKDSLAKIIGATPIDEFLAYVADLLSEFRMLSLFVGNLDSDTANSIARSVKSVMQQEGKMKPLKPEEETTTIISQLVNTETRELFLLNKNTKDHNSGLYRFIPMNITVTPENYLDTIVYSELFVETIRQDMYDELRTNQQVGYDVSAFVRFIGNEFGVIFEIYSDTLDAKELSKRLDAFLLTFRDQTLAMEDSAFEEFRHALEVEKIKPYENLSAKFNDFWGELKFQPSHFNHQKLELATLKEITRERFLKWSTDRIFENKNITEILIFACDKAEDIGAKAEENALMMREAPERIWDLSPGHEYRIL